jgi:hypothetical protein
MLREIFRRYRFKLWFTDTVQPGRWLSVSEEPAASLYRVVDDLDDGGRWCFFFFRKIATTFGLHNFVTQTTTIPSILQLLSVLSQRSVYLTKCNNTFSENVAGDSCYYILYSTSSNNTVHVKGPDKVLCTP